MLGKVDNNNILQKYDAFPLQEMHFWFSLTYLSLTNELSHITRHYINNSIKLLLNKLISTN
jgi:hypothetical protein